MRLIDADKLIEDFAHYGKTHHYDAYDLEDMVNECPTVDVLDKIRKEIQAMADDEWNIQVGASKGLEVALEVIDNYREGENE